MLNCPAITPNGTITSTTGQILQLELRHEMIKVTLLQTFSHQAMKYPASVVIVCCAPHVFGDIDLIRSSLCMRVWLET